MRNNLMRILSVILSLSIIFGTFAIQGSAATASELQQSINSLEAKSKELERKYRHLRAKFKISRS